MAYTGSTFVEFPDGSLLDIQNLKATISNGMLTFTGQIGIPIHQFQFASNGDAASFLGKVSLNVNAFNNAPVLYYDYSTNGSLFEPGPIPENAQPIYILVVGSNLSTATSATLVDSNGLSISNIPIESASSSECIVGPFAQAGQSSPAIGNAILTLYASGVPITTTQVVIGQPLPPVPTWTPLTPGNLASWLKADSIMQSSGTPVSDWPAASGTDVTASGAQQPTFITAAQNGLPVVRFDGAANMMSSNSGTPATQPLTLVVAFRLYNSAGTDYIVQSNSAGGTAFLGDGGNFTMNAGNGPVNLVAADTSFHYAFIVLNGASSTYGFDGAALQTFVSTPGSSGFAGGLVLGASELSSGFAQVDIGEVIIWNADITASYAQAAAYLQSRWG